MKKHFSLSIYKHITALTLLLFCTAANSLAQRPDSLAADTAKAQGGGLIARVMRYFEEANKPKEAKAFDISFIGGSHYSSDSGFGIGLLAAGIYRQNPADTLSQPSMVSVFADATTRKFFKVGIEGYNISDGDRRRLNYLVRFESIDTKFWGIGYDNACHDSNESNFAYLSMVVQVEYLQRIAPNVYLGPIASFDYIHGRNFQRPELWDGESNKTFNFGPGVAFRYDSRDNVSNAYRGYYLAVDQTFYPRGIGNKHPFSCTELTASGYHQAWRGAVIAWRAHSRLTYGHTPWGMLSQLGGSHYMRGYYEGRYRDKGAWDVCLELRQHVWRRSGAVVWVGAGEVFPNLKAMRLRQVLPNAGVGYRWEFKHRVNVRLDLGFGRDGAGFIFNINEAF